jgi:transcription elongation factor GreB
VAYTLVMATPEPVPLTDIGWRYLEGQRDRLAAELTLRKQAQFGEAQTDVQDTGDESVGIQLSDDATQVADQLAQVQLWLDEAVALEPAADGELIGLGSIVHVRDGDGEESRYRIVHPAEVGATDQDVSADAPVARALLGQRAGATVEVQTPGGGERLTVVGVDPYRPS